ncbi:MAG: hypothetical protein NTNFB02_01450 [Nitrospira sp.]
MAVRDQTNSKSGIYCFAYVMSPSFSSNTKSIVAKVWQNYLFPWGFMGSSSTSDPSVSADEETD